MFSIADDAVDFALANLLENADLMLSSFPPVRVFAVLMREFIVSFMPVNVADTIPLIPPPFSLYADFMWSSFVDTLDFAVSMREVALSFMFVKSVDHFVFISETFEENPDLISVNLFDALFFHSVIFVVTVVFMFSQPVETFDLIFYKSTPIILPRNQQYKYANRIISPDLHIFFRAVLLPALARYP